MEVSGVTSPTFRLHQVKEEGSEDTHLLTLEVESSNHGNDHGDHQFRSMSALEILRETVRILRFNSWAFMTIAALLICPLSAVLLSNVAVNQIILKRVTARLMLIAKSSGLPLRPFIKQSCYKFSELAVSSTLCFPLFITFSLLSKASVVYSVDCTYSRKKFDISKFFVVISKTWKRLLLTYLWGCMVIVGCITSCFVIFVVMCSAVSVIVILPDLVVYAAIMVGLVFSVVYANAVIICNLGIVISVLEDVSGPQAFRRSVVLIKGQTQVGLLLFLGSTIGMTLIEGLFEHRVKTISYGDGSSRIWEGPLLVIMYSFVVLIDYMMNAVFYFSCKSYSMEAFHGECQSSLETPAVSAESIDIQ